MRIACAVILMAASLTLPGMAAADDDYETQRFAFATQPSYDGYKLTAGEIGTSQRARTLWNQGEHDQAVKLLDDWVAVYPLSIVGHRMLGEFDTRLSIDEKDDDKRKALRSAAEQHQAMVRGLLISIAHGTQCATIEDRCRVINIAEENAIIVDAGAKTKPRQAVVAAPNGYYDMVVGRNEKGDERTFYFDISSFYKGPFTGSMRMGSQSK